MNPIQKKYFDRAYLISFFILGLFPAVPFFGKPFLVGPLVLTSLVCIFFRPLKEVNWKMLFANIGIFCVFLYSMFYSKDTEQANELILRLSPFLIFPIVFAIIPEEFYEKSTRLFFRVFTICCGLFCILIFVYAWWLPSDDIYYIYSYISKKFWGYREHPIYISLYFGIALIILLYYFKKSVFNISLAILILFTLFFLSRKGNLISLGVIGILVMYSYRDRFFNKQSIKYLVFLGLILVVSAIFFGNILFSRFQEIFIIQDWYNTTTSTGIRNTMLKTCIDLSFERPFFGYGLADVQEVIDNRLIALGYKDLTAFQQYNAHNQYIQIVLSSGYVGLLLFIGILFYNFLKNNKMKSRIGLYVFLYIIFCFLFESILERQNGVIIAALFLNLYAFRTENENNHHQSELLS